MRTVAVLISAVLLLAGCSGDDPTVSTAAGPSASPTSAALSTGEARDLFERSSQEPKAAIERMVAAVQQGEGFDLPAIRASAGEARDALREWNRTLVSTRWPEQVQQTADDMAASAAEYTAILTRVAEVQTDTELLPLMGQLRDANFAGQVELMRTRLSAA